MQIIKEQLRRVNHFLIFLIPLFVVNALFNLRYDWGGVSVIARVYIIVLSFYLIFIFSQINADDYRGDYLKRFGWKGRYYLFMVLRIFPFMFIYMLTIVFTLINYINTPQWPLEPVYRLLDGRYSNTVIYSLILFIVLRQKKRPGISIPLFIIFSMIYFTADKTLYSLFTPGPGVSLIKITKYFIFIFILVYGYSKNRWRLIESAAFSLINGFFLFASVASVLFLSFFISAPGSYSQSITGSILLKSGFDFPLESLVKSIPDRNSSAETESIFQYINKYGKEIGYSQEEWERIILKNNIKNNEFIFSLLNRRNIKLNFSDLKTYTEIQLKQNQYDPAELTEFIRHFGSYYSTNKKDFYELYKTADEHLKILILKSLAYADDIEAINFLTDKITSVDRLLSDAAYMSLKKITGEDPAAVLKKELYDIDVILFFRDYASKYQKGEVKNSL